MLNSVLKCRTYLATLSEVFVKGLKDLTIKEVRCARQEKRVGGNIGWTKSPWKINDPKV